MTENSTENVHATDEPTGDATTNGNVHATDEPV